MKRSRKYAFTTDVSTLEKGRWGVIFATGESAEVRAAIQPLIDHRKKQLGGQPPVFEYEPGISVRRFLASLGVQRGAGDVELVPYYLLLVGGPEQIPFRFQYELGTEYGVGRLAFGDPSGYRDYVDKLIDYEKSSSVPTSQEMAFWAPLNTDLPGTRIDRSSELGSTILVPQLQQRMSNLQDWDTSSFVGTAATKASLKDLFCKERAPAVVFTASHGLGLPASANEQAELQGSLLTQEWKIEQPVSNGSMFSSRDLGEANVGGMVHFAFACFGAGTPKRDDYAIGTFSTVIAKRPFVANLPCQMLARGALGFIGHIDRAWGASFYDQQLNQPMVESYRRALERICQGVPLGHALRDHLDRGTFLSSDLMEELNETGFGLQVPPASIVNLWMDRNDARAFCLLGDPGVRVRSQ